jgi:hypothetical protein
MSSSTTHIVMPFHVHSAHPWMVVPAGTPYLQATQKVIAKFLDLLPLATSIAGSSNAVVANNALGQTPRLDERQCASELNSALEDVLKLSYVPSKGTKFPRPARTRHVIPGPTSTDPYSSVDEKSYRSVWIHSMSQYMRFGGQLTGVSTMESCRHCTLKIKEIQRQLPEDQEEANHTSAINDWSLVTRLKDMVCGKCEGWIEESKSSSQQDFPAT